MEKHRKGRDRLQASELLCESLGELVLLDEEDMFREGSGSVVL